MHNTVYILVVESNDAFLGCFASKQQALHAGKSFRVPTRVFSWTVYHPADFSKLDAALQDLNDQA